MPKSSKNNSRFFEDIRKPSRARSAGKVFGQRSSKSSLTPSHSHSWGKIIFGILAVLIIAGTLVFINVSSFRASLIESLKTGLNDFRSTAVGFNPFKSKGTPPPLLVVSENLNLDQTLNDLASKFWPLLKNSLSAYSGFREITVQVVTLFQESAVLVNSLPDLIFGQRGAELITQLDEVKIILKNITEKNAELVSIVSRIEDFSTEDFDFYLPFQIDLNRFLEFLTALTDWLKSPTPHHILVVLQNPAVMRPTGGLIETYADLTIHGGRITAININDLSESDKKMMLKIIPPRPLQVITAPFEAAHANWFFDFPTSAEKFIRLVNASGLYQENDIVFEGLVAITPEVMSDFLNITGPIELLKDDTSVNQENFLGQIQKEEGLSYPREILEELTPILFEKLAHLSDTQKQELFDSFTNWQEKKDLMIYFRNPKLEQFFNSYNMTGEIYGLPQGFFGDYLAVVNANILGGKTDIFMKQKIVLASLINNDGIVNNRLVIERKHTGHEGKYRFYKVTNQNYIKIFTPLSVRLENISGGVQKKIRPLINYSQTGYEDDPLVKEIESTQKEFINYPQLESFSEFGKNVFAVWLQTNPKETDTLTLDYVHRLPTPPVPGKTYQFVFEKQAGVIGEYKFEISAPPGFIWQESNSPVFEYESSDPPARLILDLTLKKI